MKFTLLITALNDAACAQLRKADSNDLNHTHSHTHTHGSIEKHGKKCTEDGGQAIKGRGVTFMHPDRP